MRLPSVVAGPRRRRCLYLIANGFLQAAGTIAITLLIRHSFDRFSANGETATLEPWHIFGAFLLLAVVMAWLKYRERRDAELLGQEYVHEVRVKMFGHYLAADLRDLGRYGKGAISLRFATDLGAIRQWISLGLARLAVAGVNLSLTLVVLCILSPALGASVTALLAVAALLTMASGRHLRPAFAQARRQRSFLANNINEKVSAVASVKAFGQQHREKKRVARQSRRVLQMMVDRAAAIGILRSITEGTTVLALGVSLAVGGVLLQAGVTTPGTVVAALGVVSFLMQPIRHLGRVHEYRLNATVAEERIRAFPVKHSPRPMGERDNSAGRPVLSLHGLVTMPGTPAITQQVMPGQTVALLGPNGAGKSTLIAQLAGLMTPASGRMRLGNHDILTLKDSARRRAIGIVSPDLPLLKGTIAKNIRYRLPDAAEQEVQRVISLCGLDTLIASLPGGSKFRLSERAGNLSQGEAQRIALARALLGTPDLLLLDEPAAFLDDQGLQLLRRILAGYDGVVVMATPDSDQVALADEVWLMDEGTVVWSGPADELRDSDHAVVLSHLQAKSGRFRLVASRD